MRLDLSTLRAGGVAGQTEAAAAGPAGSMVMVLRVGRARVKVVRASRRFFDEIDDLMSAFSPVKPPFENHPVPAVRRPVPCRPLFPGTRLAGFAQVPHAYAQHVDNSVDNS
jgi:hypothetical protein